MNANYEKLVHEIYRDLRVTPAEVIALRKQVEKMTADVLGAEGAHGVTAALCHSFEVTLQLMQESILASKRGGSASPAIGDLMRGHIQLLQTTLDAFDRR